MNPLQLCVNNSIYSQVGDSCLLLAARGGLLSVAELLISRGTCLDARNKQRETPLYWACFNKHADIALMLLESGADVTTLFKVCRISNISGACI